MCGGGGGTRCESVARQEVGVAAWDPEQLRVTPPGDLCLRNPFLAGAVVGPSSEEQRTTFSPGHWVESPRLQASFTKEAARRQGSGL